MYFKAYFRCFVCWHNSTQRNEKLYWNFIERYPVMVMWKGKISACKPDNFFNMLTTITITQKLNLHVILLKPIFKFLLTTIRFSHCICVTVGNCSCLLETAYLKKKECTIDTNELIPIYTLSLLYKETFV